jgi:hypothetical protein
LIGRLARRLASSRKPLTSLVDTPVNTSIEQPARLQSKPDNH